MAGGHHNGGPPGRDEARFPAAATEMPATGRVGTLVLGTALLLSAVAEGQPPTAGISNRALATNRRRGEEVARLLLRAGVGGNLTGLLALLAPLAALPLIAGTALPLSMAPLLVPAMSTVLGRRRKRDLLAAFLEERGGSWADQQDQVLAGYLQCSGMLAADNRCLERLACQFSADALPQHKDVASLVIYTLLRNRFIPERFKERLRLAARQARDGADCLRRFPCEQRPRPALV
ncbi:uncharacterized protein LOC144124388 [Amblyomma americanum]